MADCIHEVALCPDCGGLEVTRLDRLSGVTSVTLDGPLGGGLTGRVTDLFTGPTPGPCPNMTTPEDPR